MKYGLLVVNKTRNIGDDIQSYVTKRFLPRIDYYIDRDHMDEFIPDNTEYVASIINGWYLQYTLNWPFSPFVYPMAVSMHFSFKDWFWDTTDRAYHLQGYGLDYLKTLQPIGCRDSHTVELLKKLGIKTEYTGCMTLTLKKFDNVKKGKYICAVDVSKSVVDTIKKQTNLEVKEITHTVPEDYYKLSWEERMKNVEELLEIYQGATAVVSYRLHCALPCLALGTDVILLNEDYRNDRFGDYLKYMNTCSEEEFVSEKVIFDFENLPKHDRGWVKLKNKLEKKCLKFIEDCENNNINYPKDGIDIENYRKYVVGKSNWLKSAAIESYNRFENEKKNFDVLLKDYESKLEKSNSEADYYKSEFNSCVKKLEECKEELESIKNSRLWKVRGIIKKKK